MRFKKLSIYYDKNIRKYKIFIQKTNKFFRLILKKILIKRNKTF